MTVVARILLPLYLAAVAWVTLGPAPWTTGANSETAFGVLGVRTWLDASTWSSGSPTEFLANIAMFVPVGILLRIAAPRARVIPTIVLVIAMAAVIEVLQLPLERVSDPRDLVANAIGGLVGVGIGAAAIAVSRSRRRARVVDVASRSAARSR